MELLRLKLILLFSFFVLSMIGTLMSRQVVKYDEEKMGWVLHTHEVMHKSQKLLSALQDAETGQRGYLLTLKDSYLEPYYKGKENALKVHNTLTRLTSDNSSQQLRLKEIRYFIDLKMAELEETVKLAKKGDTKGALQIINEDIGKEYMENIRKLISLMTDEENTLLTVRQNDLEDLRSSNIIYIKFIMGFLLAVVMLFLYQALKEKLKLKTVIADLEVAKEKADNAVKAKAKFLANMSHEIRTPMTGILGFVEQLAKYEEDPKRIKQFNIIRNSGKTLLAIINDILDISKIESGKIEIESHPLNIHEVITETTDIFSELIKSKNLTFTKYIDDQIPSCVLGDQVRIKQIIFNLLGNAIKFTPSGGKVLIEIEYDDSFSFLHCAVIDTGIGIDKEKLEKIFTPFEQGDATTTRRFGGSGLGLAISSKLIGMMGGKLRVESNVGEGSKFYFHIPLHPCPENDPHERKTQTNTEENLLFNGHVLIVDDQEFNRMLLSTILQQYGVTYDVASDGVEALNLYHHNVYDAIFMDENMPNMNGIEATKQIRNIEKEYSSTHTLIIAVTANALIEDQERFLDAGMDDYISKPYSEEDILKVLNKYLSKVENLFSNL